MSLFHLQLKYFKKSIIQILEQKQEKYIIPVLLTFLKPLKKKKTLGFLLQYIFTVILFQPFSLTGKTETRLELGPLCSVY